MPEVAGKQEIAQALAAFSSRPLELAAIDFLACLGYKSNRRAEISSVEDFREHFDPDGRLNERHALLDEWQSVHFLFQLTQDEINSMSQGRMFFAGGTVENQRIESYLFFVIRLRGSRYTRTQLASVTRAVNRLFPMPAMLLFVYGDLLTLSVINREISRRDENRDVLRKVTLIKDVSISDPLRAHLEIFDDLELDNLYRDFHFHNFVGLHHAWQERLDASHLNTRFYRDVANWYFWALSQEAVTLPRSIAGIRNKKEFDKQQSIFFIRLLTRLIFCWFLQEKNLLPHELFREHTATALLKDFSPGAGSYYRAVLQNLFFATLNQEQGKRNWRKQYDGSRDGNRGVTTVWRYKDLLERPEHLEALLRDRIPFVNGGLFDCLDDQLSEPMIFLDGFSEREDNQLCLPNDLFFGDERTVNLSALYDDQRYKHETVRGVIRILSRYKFTVEENTPLEEEIALDPELLGKVFENLLASYNEDTRTSARKALGAYYTPRQIVSYMVDESLRKYLSEGAPISDAEIDALFTPHVVVPTLPPDQRSALIRAIGRAKILDPACGSGAFPMGALHRMVDLLQKLDPNNESFKRDRLDEAERYRDLLYQANAPADEIAECDARIEDVRRSFDTRFHALDYARKLHLIENCIYGIDIQPIACQIAKLRFFIALIVDQHVDLTAANLGVTPLPNLETRIVAADALVPIERPQQQYELLDDRIRPLRRMLEQVRHDHFNARTPKRKKSCQQKDATLRAQIAELLKTSGWPAQSAKALADWNPYDQNHAASFFDTDWMFGFPVRKLRLADNRSRPLNANHSPKDTSAPQAPSADRSNAESGFDIVIGNPPYVRIQTLKQLQSRKLVSFYKAHYTSAGKGNYDLYVVFVEAGMSFLKSDGHLAYILPHKFFNPRYGEPLRKIIASGHNLQQVVHFGHQQVFPGATNYVCLLFLANAGTDECRFVRVDNLGWWLKDFRAPQRRIPAGSIDASEWTFAVGPSAAVFDRLQSMPRKLEHFADRIFQGLKTSADKVYIVEEVGRSHSLVRVYSPQTDREYDLEPDLLHPLVKGGDSRAFSLTPTNRLILFPYESVSAGPCTLISERNLSHSFPATWKYLCTNREVLEQRERGELSGPGWYAYGRSQALDVITRPKVFTPDIAPAASFSYDESGALFFTGGVSGGYGIVPAAGVEPTLLLGILNSCGFR